MTHPLSKTLVLEQADGTLSEKYDVLVDKDGVFQWWEESVGEGGIKAGDPVWRKWTVWGGGMGQVTDLRQGGYYYSKDCFVGNPWAIRPRPTKTAVTLTGNNTPVVRFFEAESASGIKYLYAITETIIYKVRLHDMTLVNTRDLSTPNVEFATGSYTSDGASRLIQLSFSPKLIIVKAIDGAYPAAFKTDDMVAGTFKEATGTFHEGAGIAEGIAISNDQIVIGGLAEPDPDSTNRSGTTYAWAAFGGDYVLAESFTGDGNDDRDIDENENANLNGWGQPDAVFILTDNDSDPVCFRNKTATADLTQDLSLTTKPVANIIEATADWPTHGFEVGSDNRANRSGATVYYVAMKGDTDVLEIGSHTGDGAATQAVITPDFEPTFALLYSADQDVPAYHRSDYNAGDSSMFFTATVNAADHIISLDSTGYTAGDVSLNTDTKTYYYLVLRPDPTGTITCGQPAKWNDIWELPLGNDVDWIGLTGILDGTGDDTWTTRTGLKATRFCTMHNKLARVYDGRKLELCSADAVQTAGNWGATYYVGQSGTVVTDLVEWEDELAILSEDGLYMYDGVAIARQQLRLLAGISDPDNGKGSANWMLNILVGTADGFMRWIRDAAPKGPDTIPGYVAAEETSGEPVFLQHYGSAFLSNWLFNAAKDPSDNYHIFTLRPDGDGFKWDGLLTDTNAITILFVDSDRNLWFNYGNNIAYIELRRGGEPGAGTFGETSDSGSLYLPEWTPADEADVRLRVVKVRVRNSKSGLAWKVYAYSDGGAAAQVGAAGGITTDGESCLYFAPASNLTAKRLRLRIDWVAGAGYTPTSDPPEVIEIEVWGEALPSDADIIRATVDLESDGIAHSTNYKALKAHENAGVRTLRHPITGEEIYVTIYQTQLFDIFQRDHEEPTGALMLHMRRSDTS